MPYIRVNYKTIHYTLYPPISDPSSPSTTTSPPIPKSRATILFHHGLGSSQNFFLPLIPPLTSKQYTCLTYDVTGCARSPSTQITQSIPSLASDALALLSAVGVPDDEKVIFVGHSLGGVVGVHLASDEEWKGKARIAALILLGPVLPGTPHLRQRFTDRINLVERDGMQPIADTLPFTALGTHASSLSRAMVRELLLGQGKQGYLGLCWVLKEAGRPGFAGVRCPVMVVAGGEDGSATVGDCREIFEALGTEEEEEEEEEEGKDGGKGKGRPGKRWVVLQGCGHWHCVEKPEEVGRAIEGFLEDVVVDEVSVP